MKCLNIAESIMKYGLPFQISHLLWQQQADATGKNMSKVCEATCMTLRISFDGNTFADKGNGLFVFRSRGKKFRPGDWLISHILFEYQWCSPGFSLRLISLICISSKIPQMWENQRTSKGNLINAITIILIDILCFYFLRLFSDAAYIATWMIDYCNLIGRKVVFETSETCFWGCFTLFS